MPSIFTATFRLEMIFERQPVAPSVAASQARARVSESEL
jgi:hypothetical protein